MSINAGTNTNLKHWGSLLALASGFLYGFIGYFGMGAIHMELSVSTMLFWRFLLSSFVMVACFWKVISANKSSISALLKAYVIGFVFYSISSLFYFYGSLYLGSGLAMVLFFSYPLVILLFQSFMGQRLISKIYYSSFALIILGISLLIDLQHINLDMIGICLVFIAACCYAAYILISKLNPCSPEESTLMVCLGGASSCFIYSCLEHSFTIPGNLEIWAHLLGISLISTVLPILLFLFSLKYISSEKASLLSVFEPVCVVIWGALLLGEPIAPTTIVGMLMVLSGAMLALFESKSP